MAFLPANRHFFSSTRGRIVLLLRRSQHTVDELAQAFQLTDNAVRSHLATLERDGLIRQAGVRRGSCKPSLVYELAPEAEQLFPKAYGVVLQQVLKILSEDMSPEELAVIMHRVGQRMATQWNIPAGELRLRLRHAVDIVNEFGGLTELEESDDNYTIRGYSCPLADILPEHPEACQLLQAFLVELVGVPIEEHCKRNETLRCLFTAPKRGTSSL
jgi:predicted ArsR family transcriptional regulator